MIRLNAIWTSPPDDGVDTWVRDVVIRKLDGYPTNLLDGEHITSSIIRDQYSSLASQYQSGPTTVDPTGHDYKYRVFHVFSSGKITYTDMTDVSIGGYFAVGSMGRDTTDTYIGSHNEVLLVWRTPSIFTTADWSYDIIDVGGTTVLDTKTSTYYAVTGGADKIARYKGTVKTSAEVTVTSHFADGSTVTVPLVRTDVWMWLKSVAELGMLTCGVIGTAHPWVAGTSTSKEYTFRCPYKKSSGSVTTYNVWTTSIEASRIELCSVWASISTPGGKTEAELQQIHWPCVAPDTELQKVANPLYIGPNNGMSTTSTTTTTNPTVCRYEISG